MGSRCKANVTKIGELLGRCFEHNLRRGAVWCYLEILADTGTFMIR